MTEREKLIFREILLIAFGYAAGDLEETLGLSVDFPRSSPAETAGGFCLACDFSGDLKGKGRIIIAGDNFPEDELLETGFAMLNSVLSRIGEMLKARMEWSRPVITDVENHRDRGEITGIVDFFFENRIASGKMEILFDEESRPQLTGALHSFMDAYR